MQAMWTRERVRAYVELSVGCVIAALSFDLFFLPNNIAPGGITGIATLINSMVGAPVGLTAIVLNIPLFLFGYRLVGRSFALRSLVAMLLLSLLIDLIPQMPPPHDMLLASVFGGLLMGIGLGMVLRAGATTGGTDLLAKMIHYHWSPISVGGVLLIIDCLVVIAAGFVFDAQAALYAMVALLVCSKVIDIVLQGFNNAKQLWINTARGADIAARITSEMDRGATLIPAIGAYSGAKRDMVFCVVSTVEVARLKALIAEIDPRAFVTVSDVHEAMGEGFRGLEQKK